MCLLEILGFKCRPIIMKSKKGLIIIYIGKGKGKTSAAVGLAVRAAGAGKKVLFTQFVKAAKATQRGEWPPSSELAVLKRQKKIKVKVLGKGFVGILGDSKNHTEHGDAARGGLSWVWREVSQNKYQVVICDELVSAIELKLLPIKEVKEFLLRVSHRVEAIAVTGHTKYNALVQIADLVTEMKMIKHPYYKGVIAQKGIDF